METLLIDCSFTKPDPHNTHAAGYDGVVGYISHTPSKDMGGQQARSYVAADLKVLFVFETTSGRALAGRAAGVEDRTFAEAEARKRGYPAGAVIFFAVDGDYDPKKVMGYFSGIHAAGDHARYRAGVYGSLRVIEAVLRAKYVSAGWQTEAWSGVKVSELASLYQRIGKTAPPIHGVKGSAYDEDVVLKPINAWGGVVAPPVAPKTGPQAIARTVRAAIRLVTRALQRRTRPLMPHGRVLVTALVKAGQHALNVGQKGTSP